MFSHTAVGETCMDDNCHERDGPQSQFVVSQVLGTLAPDALEAFRREQAGPANATRAGWIVFECEMTGGLPIPLKPSDRQDPLWQEIVVALDGEGSIGTGVALAAHLALVIDGNDERLTRIMVLSDGAIARALRSILCGAEMTAAEMRLLKQLVCGVDLAEAARADGVSHETKRTQYKSLARKFGARSQGELTVRTLAHLLINPGVFALSDAYANNDLFAALADEFLPHARCHVLQGPDKVRHRFIDLGPGDGRPVVFVHPQILPDFRPEDIEVLRARELRLIVPLRHGAMAQGGSALNVSDHLDHACKGIDLARTHFASAQADLLLCISGAAYGIEYARRHPERVASLAFAGAPAIPAADASNKGRFRSGLMRLATSDGALFSRMIDFLGRRINRPDTLRRLLMNYYRPCPADLAMIESEYAAPHGGERLRKQITLSMSSIRQDLHHQVRPHWHDLPKGRFPVTFLHGDKDYFYPIDTVRALADELGGYPVHAIPEAGQLLYYRHFAPLLEAYHGFVTGDRNL